MREPEHSFAGTAARAAAALALAAALAAPAVAEPGMRVEIARSGDAFMVDAHLVAPVPPREAWAVLTDFEHMSAFVPNLVESRVAGRSASRLTVAQKGVARFGVVSFPFESVREVDLVPHESVRSRTVGGTAGRVESFTRLAAAGAGTRIHYHLEVVPGFWFPGFVGEALLEQEVREQFEAIVQEMLRRQRAAAPPRAGAPAT
ncbi:MAG: SRPBCC family protein [Burkholderiales bacterium]|nr:SRPBCC family protein [Burkholderiales bacterium]